MPEVDIVIGINEKNNLDEIIKNLSKMEKKVVDVSGRCYNMQRFSPRFWDNNKYIQKVQGCNKNSRWL